MRNIELIRRNLINLDSMYGFFSSSYVTSPLALISHVCFEIGIRACDHQVRLVPYDPEYLDESVLWTESRDVGRGFRCIRMVNNIYLNFDAFHGDKDHGGVHDGTTVVLWKWCNGDNQSWKILPYYCMQNSLLLAPHYFIYITRVILLTEQIYWTLRQYCYTLYIYIYIYIL